MRIYSFTGPRGSGKDTCALILKNEGISQGKISFAGPMKTMLAEIYGLDRNVFEDERLKETQFPRALWFGHYECRQLIELMQEYSPHKEYHPLFMPTYLTTPRAALQYVGTEVIRNLIDDHWHVKAAFSERGLEGLDPEGTYCVTDARFKNEYEWLNNRFMLDFKGFYVMRPEAEIRLATATHLSERAVCDVLKLMNRDQILDNSGSLEELTEQLKARI